MSCKDILGDLQIMAGCPCDKREFPPKLSIDAGLSNIPRQLAGFTEFRNAMLAAIRSETSLDDWKARYGDDLGIMLMEMWAYICDSISFYDEIIASETYLRTAKQRTSVRKLVGLLGYLPRPAVAASVCLAAIADGRQLITLPPGTAFRSGAFDDEAPQVFETGYDQSIHPFTNRWPVLAPEPKVLEKKNPNHLILDPLIRLVAGNRLLLTDKENKNHPQIVKISDTKTCTIKGRPCVELWFEEKTNLVVSTRYASLNLLSPSRVAKLLCITDSIINTLDTDDASAFLAEYEPFIKTPVSDAAYASKEYETFESSLTIDKKIARADNIIAEILFNDKIITLDGLYPDISTGDYIMLSRGGDFRWFQIVQTQNIFRKISADQTTTVQNMKYTIAGASGWVTQIVLDVPVNNRKSGSFGNWTTQNQHEISVHYDLQKAGTLIGRPRLTLSPGDDILSSVSIEKPDGSYDPAAYMLYDKNLCGVKVNGTFDYDVGQLNLSQPVDWDEAMTLPVEVFSNLVEATRGETVKEEILGSGDASLANQTFKLKKKPLTYLFSPSAENDQGVVSTLEVRVDGILWTEAVSFYKKTETDQIYIVRQTDDDESLVIFGDGINGQRLPSGTNNVVAGYRFGAGQASPPAASITQIAKPFKGLKSIQNPVAAFGGADREELEDIRSLAPKSALILGRAVSLQDMEALVSTVAGVVALQVAWAWSKEKQCPLVQVRYIGDDGIATDILERLRRYSDPTVMFQVAQANNIPVTLVINVGIDSRYLIDDVMLDVREKLMDTDTGMFSLKNIGIGKAVIRSRIYEAVISVEGVLSVGEILWNDVLFNEFAKCPGSGNYFKIEIL